jgi:AsmA protein
MKKLVLRLDDATIKGHVSIKGFAKPEIAFDLRADKIDVDRYLPPKPEKRAKLKKKALPPGKAAHKGKRGLSLEPLRALELDGRLRIGKVKVYNLKMKDIRLTITAHKGIIRLHPLQASLYRGKYSGDMIFDVHGKVAKISTKENVKGVQVGPLLRDLIGEEKLSGTADVSVRITTKGNTDMALRKALNGKASFSVADGCLRGYVVPGTGSNRWSDPEDEDSKPAKKITSTDFSEARGTVWIRNGVARNNDFKFYSPSVKATGKGHADLFAEQLDYLLYVKIPSMPTFPIRIHGPFSNPRSDLQVGKMVKGTLIGIVKGLEDTAKKGKEAIQNIGKGVRDIFKGIFQ